MWYKFANDQININIPNSLREIIQSLDKKGSRALLVGGVVRDAYMNVPNKDIDIEVYNTSYEELENELKSVPGAKVDTVGKSFGIIKVNTPDGEEYDFSIPRRDSKKGIGHTGFDVEFDQSISPEEAAARRDFTMNALAYDPIENKVLDFFGGVEDIKNGVLRHTSAAFAEDSLRVLRGLQFAARFGMEIAPETAELSKSIIDQYSDISIERIEGEWKKLVEKGKHPGAAIKYLQDTGWIDHYPEIKGMIGVPQEPDWHPEGDVDLHTAHVMNAAARIADNYNLQGDDRAVLIYAALSHDFAKAHTTEQKEVDGVMRWTAHGHEKAGGPLAESFLKSIGVKRDIIKRVIPIVENHLAHIQFDANTPIHLIRRLAERLYPGTIKELAMLIEADHSGRPPIVPELPEQARIMLEKAESEGIHTGKTQILVRGQDLQDIGLPPGPLYGEVIKATYQAQLDGKIHTREEALEWLKKLVRPHIAFINGKHPFFAERGIQGPRMGQILGAVYEAQLNGQVKNEQEAVQFMESMVGV
jgi:tRNA nucleotidyltransferase (CCA-adding enzyme)